MELINLTFYSVFFLVAAFLTGFNIIYSFRVHNSNYKIGIKTPDLIKRALQANTIILLIGTLILGIVLGDALLSFRFPMQL